MNRVDLWHTGTNRGLLASRHICINQTVFGRCLNYVLTVPDYLRLTRMTRVEPELDHNVTVDMRGKRENSVAELGDTECKPLYHRGSTMIL